MIPAADKARWHLFTRDEETAAPVTLLFRRWVQTVRRGPAREPDRARSLSEEPAAPDGAFHTPREAPSPRFSSGLFHGRRTSCHLIKWVPGACGLKRGGKDPAPLTLSLWNSLTQELWKLNVATLVGMQMAADTDAHGDKGSRAAPALRAHSSGKGPPKASSAVRVCFHGEKAPCQDCSLCT